MKYLKLYSKKADGDRDLVETPFIGMATDLTPLIVGTPSRAQKVRLTVKDDVLLIEDYTLPELRAIAVWINDKYTSTSAFNEDVSNAILDGTATSKYDFNADGSTNVTDISTLGAIILDGVLPYTGKLNLGEIKALALMKLYGTAAKVVKAISDYIFLKGSEDYEFWFDVQNDGHVNVSDISQFVENYWYLFPKSTKNVSADEEEGE